MDSIWPCDERDTMMPARTVFGNGCAGGIGQVGGDRDRGRGTPQKKITQPQEECDPSQLTLLYRSNR